MATIDYKQKIKDYMNSSEVDTLYKSMLNNLFPELKESEDERIRKSISAYFAKFKPNDMWNADFSFGDIVVWLEKQCGKGTNGNERKISIPEPPLTIKHAKEVMGIKQDDAWSEEDEKCIENAIMYCEWARDIAPNLHCYETSEKSINWLKSFKDRVQPQPKQEWSEEDEQTFIKSVEALEDSYNFMLADWLKKHKNQFLKPQNTWKPSESDIRILEQVIDGTANPINYHATLHAILEKLKKLREE